MKKKNNFARMEEIWSEAYKIGTVITDTTVVYRGVSFQKKEDTLLILSTARDFYAPLPEPELLVFIKEGFTMGMIFHLSEKYTRQIERVNGLIQKELAYRRNQKRIEYLKNTRNGIQRKYNQLATR